ncbi:hypothetical protein [Streptomyces sp. NRRL F-5755]|uniref:hypothetical protein n=1 Tax=Streptomyces sp. NRRL F-5755 TaxID=1519475 RepID=UPI001F166759|nr:hypothetical protein [Streptomyces sp. NRRL F-5755]
MAMPAGPPTRWKVLSSGVACGTWERSITEYAVAMAGVIATPTQKPRTTRTTDSHQ